jgi:ABC-2 type transport system ATP-binding protein
MSPIEVNQLSKTFRVPERKGGFKAALGSVFRRRFKQVKAVEQVNFEIEEGEIVGFLGPNGAVRPRH